MAKGTADGLQSYGPLVLRLVLGAAMAFHGYQKVVPHGALVHHEQFVRTLGLPGWLGIVSAWTEFAGGILLLLGLLTRFAAFMVAGNLLVALVKVTMHHGYGGSEYPLALLAMAIALVLLGGGAWAIDRRIGLS